ncbi:MAG: Dehydrogenase [Rhodobacteraceae bacterium HLUCCA12]|nr:MAG: Dehydrogenase [Rhodobacteraceae bacterium HLUCCA12]
MKRFDGKVVLITGGGGAIGSAAARRFHAEGARVCVVDMDFGRAEEVAGQFGDAGLAIAADVAVEDDSEHAVSECLAHFNRLDVVFNNAGISGTATPVQNMEVEEWDRVLQINLRGVFMILRASLRAMIDRAIPGSIVNMGSSMAGWDVLSGGAHYAASKHAIVGLTKTAALDAAPWGIRINAICPGVIETTLGVPASDRDSYLKGVARFAKRIPLRRIGTPDDVAATVCFLASEDARHVTGADWLIDGGQTLQSWANAPAADAYPSSIDGPR